MGQMESTRLMDSIRKGVPSARPARWRRVRNRKENGTTSTFVSREISNKSLFPALNLILVNESPSCTAQLLFGLVHLCWDSEGVSLCASPLRVKSQFPTALWLS